MSEMVKVIKAISEHDILRVTTIPHEVYVPYNEQNINKIKEMLDRIEKKLIKTPTDVPSEYKKEFSKAYSTIVDMYNQTVDEKNNIILYKALIEFRRDIHNLSRLY